MRGIGSWDALWILPLGVVLGLLVVVIGPWALRPLLRRIFGVPLVLLFRHREEGFGRRSGLTALDSHPIVPVHEVPTRTCPIDRCGRGPAGWFGGG